MADPIRIYFDVTTVDDALLKTYIYKNQAIVNQSVVNESSEYVESFAISLGVDIKTIAVPTPYKVSKMAEFFCYMTIAQMQSTFSKGGEATNDSFALKYEMYRKRLVDIEASITALTFTNGVQAKKRRFPLSIPMSRS